MAVTGQMLMTVHTEEDPRPQGRARGAWEVRAGWLLPGREPASFPADPGQTD